MLVCRSDMISSLYIGPMYDFKNIFAKNGKMVVFRIKILLVGEKNHRNLVFQNKRKKLRKFRKLVIITLAPVLMLLRSENMSVSTERSLSKEL
jgi:hypothetical protein